MSRFVFLHGLDSYQSLIAAHLVKVFGDSNVVSPDLPYRLRGRLGLRGMNTAVRVARRVIDHVKPEATVAMSLGAWVALRAKLPNERFVFLAPAWKKAAQLRFLQRQIARRTAPILGTAAAAIARPFVPGAPARHDNIMAILHSPEDEVVPIADSFELARINGMPDSRVIQVGKGHRLSDPESLDALTAVLTGTS